MDETKSDYGISSFENCILMNSSGYNIDILTYFDTYVAPISSIRTVLGFIQAAVKWELSKVVGAPDIYYEDSLNTLISLYTKVIDYVLINTNLTMSNTYRQNIQYDFISYYETWYSPKQVVFDSISVQNSMQAFLNHLDSTMFETVDNRIMIKAMLLDEIDLCHVSQTTIRDDFVNNLNALLNTLMIFWLFDFYHVILNENKIWID